MNRRFEEDQELRQGSANWQFALPWRQSLASYRLLIQVENAVGGTTNCVNCAVALDATLGGSRAAALLGKAVPLNEVPGVFRRSRFDAAFTNISGVQEAMTAAGAGARGIVVGVGPRGGHAFNAVNQRGVIQLLDGQTGRSASVAGYWKFYLILNP